VGPVWRGGGHGEAALLAACHRNSLQLAADNGLASIAFPAISCGVYGYPLRAAAGVAVETVAGWLQAHDGVRVQLCCFSPDSREAFEQALAHLAR
jgi:O-acetyl-ADP-ribose deacetylase (regulator of RNase III)